MNPGSGPRFPALLWPALAAEATSELAYTVARELVQLAMGAEQSARTEPDWTSPNEVALELTTARLRDFSTGQTAPPTLICAPFALHGATICDFASRHSLVGVLLAAGLQRLLVTDWRSASPDMRFLSIDSYLADLNVMVDELGGTVDLVGLCQGGWLALIYTARFPAKVGKLVLAGAPVDPAAGRSKLSDLARSTPTAVFKEMVALGGGRVLGQSMLPFWAPDTFDSADIRELLQADADPGMEAFPQLERRFRDWFQWTVNLPGVYYLQVVEQLYKENRLAGGRFIALGRRVALAAVECPLYLLAARDDEVVAPQQLIAAERLVGTRPDAIAKTFAPCGHLGLFMGRRVLSNTWPEIARWLRQRPDAPAAADHDGHDPAGAALRIGRS
jgi:poly(3-hydroxyalkanoate) synthetase